MATEWDGSERRKHPIPEELVEAIAEKAAQKAVERMTQHVYTTVGRSVLEKATWIVGACCVGVYLWLKSKGFVE